ncbi:MAG: hypothetical protein EXR73_06190 [Myxococcales bacterium]|nr:hypothetical protein [Myxococcales bacterium]
MIKTTLTPTGRTRRWHAALGAMVGMMLMVGGCGSTKPALIPADSPLVPWEAEPLPEAPVEPGEPTLPDTAAPPAP